MTQQECIEDYRKKTEQKIIDLCTENDKVLLQIVDSLSSYLGNLKNREQIKFFTLGMHDQKNDSGENIWYTIYILRQKDSGSNEITKEYVDFISDVDCNIYGLNVEQLDKIFGGDDFDLNGDSIRCGSVSFLLSEDGNTIEMDISFPIEMPGMYNKADTVYATLFYSEQIVGENINSDTCFRINEHWYIIYSVYWSPAI